MDKLFSKSKSSSKEDGSERGSDRNSKKNNSREDSKEKDDSKKTSSKDKSREGSSRENSKEDEDKKQQRLIPGQSLKDHSSSREEAASSGRASRGSSKSNSKDQNSKDISRANSKEEDKSNKSTEEKRKQRLSKQQVTERSLTSSSSDTLSDQLLEDEEQKLLKQLEDESEGKKQAGSKHSSIEKQTDHQSNKQAEQSNVDQEADEQQDGHQFDQSPSRRSDDVDLQSKSSERDKLINDHEERKSILDRRRSSSIYPPDSESLNLDKRGLRTKLGRGSQVFLIDENLTMQIDGGKRRLSSFFSTSSNEETVITMDEAMTEEEMAENIKTHRQIIANTKTQHWAMHRKLKVLRKAKHYLKKHEGDMKQSSQAKDILAIYRSYVERAFRRMRREIDNLVVVLTPWEMRIKKIESQFGSVVASYFTFLRWIFWINTFVGVSYVIFVMVPEMVLFERKNYNSSRGLRKIKEEVDKPFLTTISDINEFEGFLKFSPIFYGFYDTDDEPPNLDSMFYYPLPLLYFVLTLVLFLFSFFFILRKMSQNAKLQRVGTKEDEYTFCWKLYTGWDYMIGNRETAHNKVAAIVMSLKEVILEEKEKKKEVRNWKLIVKRIVANLLILVILCSSAYAVVLVVERSQRIEATNFFQRNEVNFVFAGLQFVCPHMFTIVSMLEDNHPRIALRWQLGRILVLNILNFVCLLLSTFEKVHSQTKQLKEIKENLTILYTLELEENKTLDLSNFVTQSIISSVTLTAIVREKRQEGEGRLFPPISVNRDASSEEDSFTTAKSPFLHTIYYEEQLEGRLIKPKFVDESNYFKNNYNISIYNNRTERPIDALFTPVQTTTTLLPPLLQTKVPPSIRPTKYPILSRRTTTTHRPIRPLLTTTTKKPPKTIQPPDDKAVVVIDSENNTELIPIFQIDDNSTMIDGNQTEDQTSSTPKKRKRPTVLTTTPLPNCTQNEEIVIDPFTLFEFAQKLEREGFQNYTTILKGLCWETSFGQELVKLTLTDLYIMIVSTIFADYLRAVAVRYCNNWPCCFFDLEITFPGYADFSIAENILSLTNSQGIIWLGMFFAPGLPIINTFKLYIMMYFKSWAVITSNIPHETVFKASGNNNFYYFLLLLMLFLACFPVAYCLVFFEPSWHCGPYSNYHNIYHVMTKKLEQKLPNNVNKAVDYISSSAFIIPIIMFKILIIYYMYTSLTSLKASLKDLKGQLRKDKDSSVLEHGKDIAGSNAGVITQDSRKQVRIEEPLMNDESHRMKMLKELKDVIDSKDHDDEEADDDEEEKEE